MRITLKNLFLLIFTVPLLFGCLSTGTGAHDDNNFTVVGIQLSVSPELYRTEEVFTREMSALIALIDGIYHPDLIVLPEYSGVFLSLIPYLPEILTASNYEEAFKILSAKRPAMECPGDLFIRESERVESYWTGLWSRIASKHGVFILPGSVFLKDEQGKLKNRGMLFGRDGELLYIQDKVYLTDFEINILEISPGDMNEPRTVSLDGLSIGFSICRDTFFPALEEQLLGADLWIDIKANGVPFTQEEEELFQKALPERILSSGVPYGMTVCLTGSFLDLLWEGVSSAIMLEDGSLKVISEAPGWSTQEVVVITLPER